MRALATLSMMHLALTGEPVDPERLTMLAPPPIPDPPIQETDPTPRNRHERRAQAARARRR